MCGFVGIYNKNGLAADLQILSKMSKTLNHRGPDDEGYFIDENIGLYHKRLSIIDLKHGHQPITDENCTIVFNGEIYNYLELRTELKKKSYKFKTNSDTEVLLKMYKEYGTSCLEKLNGMFSFIIYDKRKNILFAARDRFGIKPLYYYNLRNQLIFASEIKAILAHPEVIAAPDYNSINEYLTFQFTLGEETLFKGIKKLLPGHFMTVHLKSNQFSITKYWEPNYKIDHYRTEEYFIDELKYLLNDSVSLQLRSDVPIGTYLSGGMDSTIITLISANLLDEKLKTFTGAFDYGDDFDETRYSKEVANICNAERHEIYPTENEFVQYLPEMIYFMDEPVAGPGLFPQYMVSKYASEKVKVILGGQGGDEVFGGYARYVVAYLEQALKGEILQNNEEGEHIVSLHTILPNLPYLKNYLPMLKQFMKHNPFECMDKRYFNLIDRLNGNKELFTDNFLSDYNSEKIFIKFKEIFNHPDTLSFYNKMTNFDLNTSLPALLHVEDRVSMASSMESRVPFLDHRIVELIAKMPPSMKFKGAEMKYILKKAMKELIPKKIMDRQDKMGFPVPLHIWAKNGASSFIKDILLSKNCRERNIFDTKKIEKLISSERPFGRAIWGLLNLELWFNTFIDNKDFIERGKNAVSIR